MSSKDCVFYIDTNHAYFFGSNIATMLKLSFGTESVGELEIIDKEKFYNLIQTFIKSNNIHPSNILIILSTSVTFEKDLSKIPFQEQDKHVQNFLEVVPFESTLNKVFKHENKTQAIAVNKDFLDVVKNNFEQQKFSFIGAVPGLILQENIPEFAKELNLNTVLNKIDVIKQYNLLNTEETTRKIDSRNNDPLKRYRLLILVGVFGILITILVVLIFQTTSSSKKTPASKTTQTLTR